MGSIYSFEGDYSGNKKVVRANLLLIHFTDENGIHIIYSPHLDLSGYGKTEKEAKESFELVFKEFLDYTIKKKTLGKLLQKLGWKIKGSLKHPRKMIVPELKSVLDNNYVSEIFDKYETHTYHQPVKIPAFA